MFNDDEYEKPCSLIRAHIEIDCLRDNALTLKNCIMDQACLLRVLDNRNESIKRMELENLKLKQEFLKIGEEKSLLPQKIDELNEELEKTQMELQGQKLLNDQVRFNNNNAAERIAWKNEQKKLVIVIGDKDKQLCAMKDLCNKYSSECKLQKEYYENIIVKLEETVKKQEEDFGKKINSKRKKIRGLKKLIIKKHLECREYRNLYKKLKFNNKKR